MPKTLVRVAVSFLFLVSALVLLASVTTFTETGAGRYPAVISTVIPTVCVPVTVYVYVPVYQTLTQTVQVSVTVSATVTSATTSVTTTSSSVTFSQSVTQWNTVTSVTTAVGVLGPWVNNVFKQYSDVGMIAVGLVIATTAIDAVIMLAMRVAQKDAAALKRLYAEMLERLQKHEDTLQTDRAKKLEERLEAELRAERVLDLGWLNTLKWIALIIALLILFAILLLSLLGEVACFWC
jgi:hypothetical protein